MNGNTLPWLILAVVVALFLFKRSSGKISSAEARALVANGARLVDVRSPGEFASSHLDGALNLPVDQIGRRMAEIGPKQTAVVVYCASGMRSASAAKILKDAGYSTVADLGAMGRW